MLHSFDSASKFLDTCRESFRQNEAHSAFIWGRLETLAAQGEAPGFQGWVVTAAGKKEILLSAMMEPGRSLVLNPASHLGLIRFLAQKLASVSEVTGFVGPVHEVEIFASEWKRLRGGTSSVMHRLRLHQCFEVVEPRKSIGECRLATSADRELLAQWLMEFEKETHPHSSPQDFETWLKASDRFIEKKFSFFWFLEGRPVATVSLSRPTDQSLAVMGVYTPAELRGKGYASALTAEVTRRVLSEGRKFCLLFTDLENPTSNSIYSKLGYQAIGDSLHLKWSK